MTEIVAVHAREILDSRGNPTVEVELATVSGFVGRASVPSGASTGQNEAVELRDGEKDRYGGKGVQNAVANVNGELAQEIVGLDVTDQRTLDMTMIEADGTENKEAQFTTPEQRCARHILFNKDQKEKAEEVKQQLENGADFAQLARENSQDPGSAEQGGDLGCLGKGDTVPEFEEALFGAEKGEIVGPVETQFGYHVIEVTESRAASTRPLSDVEGEIREQLSGDLQAQEFATWVQNQEQKRDVKYLEGYKPPA